MLHFSLSLDYVLFFLFKLFEDPSWIKFFPGVGKIHKLTLLDKINALRLLDNGLLKGYNDIQIENTQVILNTEYNCIESELAVNCSEKWAVSFAHSLRSLRCL